MIPTLGKLETRNPRDVWKNEERDFTPWLAANIGELSQLLGVPIIVEQTEHRVGSYVLDIFGRLETNDAVVIVENQLGPTDHSHLGQLITYAAGLEAAVVVWVATEVRDEHKAAVDWLNQHTGNSVSFFLVKPEVLSINGSAPAVRFDLAAAPSEFARRLRSVIEQDDRPSHEFRLRFWEALFAYLVENGHPWAKGRTPTKDNWFASTVGKSGVGVHVSMAADSRMRVEIYLSSQAAKSQFDYVAQHKDSIQALFPDEPVSWERLDGAVAARIAVYRDYDKAGVTTDTDERRQLFSWIASRLTALRSVAKQYVVDAQPNN
jgi:hypothetical protein